ncbi:MAG: hypothetical protein IJW67_05120 [Blautia sp.]|nr:hypothetical protein [Blautia sp.]
MDDKKKNLIAVMTLVMAAAGVIVNFVSKQLGLTFSAGTWVCFAAFIASLAAVKDHGSNHLAASAFWLTFLSMFLAIYLGAEM